MSTKHRFRLAFQQQPRAGVREVVAAGAVAAVAGVARDDAAAAHHAAEDVCEAGAEGQGAGQVAGRRGARVRPAPLHPDLLDVPAVEPTARNVGRHGAHHERHQGQTE